MQKLSYSALILAGGRSSRLGGEPKALLTRGSRSLLEEVVAACPDARPRIVVGPADLPLPAGVLSTREEPVFSGPASAISAGLELLTRDYPDLAASSQHWVLLLSCDLPRARELVPRLLEAAASLREEAKGVWALSDGITQPLIGIYRASDLLRAFAGETAHASVRRFLKPLHPLELALPSALTADVDTWEAARAAGYSPSPLPR